MATTTVRRRRLGIALRQHRGDRTAKEVAAKIEVHETTIGRLERGKIQARPVVLKALLDEYGVTGVERERLLSLAREAGQSGWWRAYAGIVSERHLDHIALEAEATRISTWEPTVVPALLQTEAYARAMQSRAGFETFTAAQLEARVKARIERQDRIAGESPPALFAILDESVLMRPVGDSGVLREQLRHLLKVAELPNVTIQVLPINAGAHAGMGGSVTILDYEEGAEDLSVAFLETIAGDMYLDEAPDLRVCRATFDMLRSDALSPAETRKLIERLLREDGAE